MTAERHGVAAKVIATVDDLDRIAADDEADVPALSGWRRELFGNKALALKQGRLSLAIEKGRVVAVEREGPPSRRRAGRVMMVARVTRESTHGPIPSQSPIPTDFFLRSGVLPMA